MKIAIITQPLINNYGCLLQNYALQHVLKKMGHEPITFDQDGWMPAYSIRLKLLIKRLFSCDNDFKKFVRKYIISTKKAKTINDFVLFHDKYKPDAYIVGSDQVWRPRLNLIQDSCFLTFVENVKKLSYAASLGTDEWEFSNEDTIKYSNYIKKFDAISVREKSASKLCEQYFKVKPIVVLDPTLLLQASDYDQICKKNNINKSYLFTYILDTNSFKQDFIKAVSEKFRYNEVAGLTDMFGKIQKRLSVEEWISYLKQSSFVICDSFHGTVFSILFHRPFIVLGNKERGNTRLISLLEELGLIDRLYKDIPENLNFTPINWDAVDIKLNKLRKESLNFLYSNL